MKNIILISITFLSITSIVGQTKYFTKTGNIIFEASVPSFEEIKSENNSVTAIIDAETQEFAVLALMKAFRFKIALMEEHFNENYLESDTYPKATFKGKLVKFELSKLSQTPQKIELNGILNIHNKSKEISTIALISLKDNSINLTANFNIKPEDFDVKIPSIVKEKIAKEINIHIHLDMQKK